MPSKMILCSLAFVIVAWFAPLLSAVYGTITNHSAAICQPASSLISLLDLDEL